MVRRRRVVSVRPYVCPSSGKKWLCVRVRVRVCIYPEGGRGEFSVSIDLPDDNS